MGNPSLGFLTICEVASKAITAVIQSQFREPYHTWGEIPGKTVGKWLEKFQEHVSWDPKDHYLVEKLFNSKGSKRFSEMLMEVRKNGACPTWIGEGAYAELNAKWKAPEYKEKCTKAKQNRASSKGGSMHTGGSISITEHVLRLDGGISSSSTTFRSGDATIQLSLTSSADSSASAATLSSPTFNTGQPFSQRKLFIESQSGKSSFHKLLEPQLPQLPGIAPYRAVLGNVKDKVLLQIYSNDNYVKSDA